MAATFVQGTRRGAVVSELADPDTRFLRLIVAATRRAAVGADVRVELLAPEFEGDAKPGRGRLHVWPGGFHGSSGLVPRARISQEAVAARLRWLQRLLDQS